MTDLLIVVALVLITLVVCLQFLLLRKSAIDLSPLQQAHQLAVSSYERTERSIREDISRNRDEASRSAKEARDEFRVSLQTLSDSMNQQLLSQTQASERRLEKIREDSLTAALTLRGEVHNSITTFAGTLTNSIGEISKAQSGRLDAFGEQLYRFTLTTEQRLQSMQEESGKKIDQLREDSHNSAKALREEVGIIIRNLSETLAATVIEMAKSQTEKLTNFAATLEKLTSSNEQKLDAMREVVGMQLVSVQESNSKHMIQNREESLNSAKLLKDEVTNSLKTFNEVVATRVSDIAQSQKVQLESMQAQLVTLTESNQQRLESLKVAVEEKLKSIQEDNTKQLELMRSTVDEKLQGTLEKRLGESFKHVSDRLEQVHKGLGEMQVLATGVGDLKRVLSNVKTRGTWGEVQLGALLEQVLTQGQYATNVAPKGGAERVEFAVKMPGRSVDEDVVWLPIDAKFPVADYQRLVEAQENADPVAAEQAALQLDAQIKQCAKDICDKYLNPPTTTDFGILFLPTEGLFAEVLRRPGLAEHVQSKSRVVIAGPTTLWSILNSLQMGFRTLAIQKRSSEVWNLLAAVKTEWTKYGEVLEKVKKKLGEASNTVDAATKRTNAIGRKLKDVQELPEGDAATTLMLSGVGSNVDPEDDESERVSSESTSSMNRRG